MKLGNKLVKLRKQNNLSQELLAEQIGVTRQTISNWETDQTRPDIEQVKELSKLFKISIDELVENDTRAIVEEKVSNTEKLSGLILKILKVFIGLSIVAVVLMIAGIFLFSFRKQISTVTTSVNTQETIRCELDENHYSYEVTYDEQNNIIESGGDSFIEEGLDLKKYKDVDQVKNKIIDYFETKGGTCSIE